jgi:hypothetical protein
MRVVKSGERIATTFGCAESNLSSNRRKSGKMPVDGGLEKLSEKVLASDSGTNNRR